MNDRNITVTVPLIAAVCKRTANYFTELAAELSNDTDAHGDNVTGAEIPAAPVAPVAVAPVAPVAPVAVAPVAPVAARPPEISPANWDGSELDGENRPHDSRIHADTKTKLKKMPHGFKLKRGMAKDNPALVAQVYAEMAAAGYGPNAQPPAVAPVPPVAVAPVAPVPPVAVAPVAPVPPVAVAPVAPVAAAPVAPVTPRSAADVMEYMSARTTDPVNGIAFVTAIPAILVPYGLTTVAEVTEELAAQIYVDFENKWAELCTPA